MEYTTKCTMEGWTCQDMPAKSLKDIMFFVPRGRREEIGSEAGEGGEGGATSLFLVSGPLHVTMHTASPSFSKKLTEASCFPAPICRVVHLLRQHDYAVRQFLGAI
jgi:hypothetical protein